MLVYDILTVPVWVIRQPSVTATAGVAFFKGIGTKAIGRK